MAGGSTIETPVTPVRRILTSSFFPLVSTQAARSYRVSRARRIRRRYHHRAGGQRPQRLLWKKYWLPALAKARWTWRPSRWSKPASESPFSHTAVDGSLSNYGHPLLTSAVLSHGYGSDAQLGTTECYRGLHSPQTGFSGRTIGIWCSIARFQKYRLGVGKNKTVKPTSVTYTRTQYYWRLLLRVGNAASNVLEVHRPGTSRATPGRTAGVYQNGVIIKDGQTIDCDLVVLSLGSGSPTFCLKNIASCWRANLMCSFIVTCCTRISPGWRLQALTMALCTFQRLKSACCGCRSTSGDLTLPDADEMHQHGKSAAMEA